MLLKSKLFFGKSKIPLKRRQVRKNNRFQIELKHFYNTNFIKKQFVSASIRFNNFQIKKQKYD